MDPIDIIGDTILFNDLDVQILNWWRQVYCKTVGAAISMRERGMNAEIDTIVQELMVKCSVKAANPPLNLRKQVEIPDSDQFCRQRITLINMHLKQSLRLRWHRIMGYAEPLADQLVVVGKISVAREVCREFQRKIPLRRMEYCHGWYMVSVVWVLLRKGFAAEIAPRKVSCVPE